MLTGDPVTLADAVAFNASITGSAAVAVSASGLVAYRAGAASRRQLTWRDRTGTVLGTLGAPDENNLPAWPRTAAVSSWPARHRATPTSGCWTARA